ncbi:MAG: transcriptional regulator [Saccharopolyspora sp.]|uniref:transcriptional regulator n=1 Tax=Saccharopolyspora sp. TaxID=33915 RepID=UPI0025F85C3E|nr:transcriptional regulator [Saccharopolyspora sp.]MBQ6643769.1 transcriptional regulator [Saccharopolyspora sp.]
MTARLLERIFGEPIDTLLAEPVESAEAEALTSSAADGGSGPPVQNRRSANKAARSSRPAALGTDVDASDFGSALDWLDEHAGWSPDAAKHKVRSRLARLSAGELLDRNARRSRVRRSEVADALADYYGQSSADCSLYNVACDGNDFRTSIVTRPEWVDFGCPVTPDRDLLTLDERESSTGADLDTKRAVHRLAEAAALDVRLTNAPLYRLQDVDLTNGSISGLVGLTPFVEYALTADLLEGELLDAISAGQSTRPSRLPLRNEYLPDLAAVLDLPGRVCAGGPLALCAIARPADPYRGPADFALLVQERSGSVLNAAGQLAVIPKGFHQPLKEPRAEARIGATLRREVEEELFGRAEVDSTAGESRVASPMHRTRLSEPMRWLSDDPDRVRMECTGFGFNLVSGNYEFASLVVIEDEEFWARYGGAIEANWEASGLRLYSTEDRELLNQLVADERWSNEGLFALLQGIRRLGERDDPRLDLPTVDAAFTRSANGR